MRSREQNGLQAVAAKNPNHHRSSRNQGTFSNPPNETVRVFIVGGSELMRRLMTRFLSEDARFQVVGFARGGSAAVTTITHIRPDVVILDEELPEADQTEAISCLQGCSPPPVAVVCNPFEERCSLVAVRWASSSEGLARMHGEGLNLEDLPFAARVRAMLAQACRICKEHADTGLARSGDGLARSTQTKRRTVVPRTPDRVLPQVLVLGCSTGGPAALAEMLPMLPADFPLPVLIVQHMPPHFTKLLAERLSRISRIPVVEAESGMEVKPGVALLAPGDFHMRVVRKLHRVDIELTQDEQENSCRPAVDVLFRSVAEVYRDAAIAAVLTGMGQDGLKGVRALKAKGAPVLVQDRETSVVWGMPGAIAAAGLADAVLPLVKIMPEVVKLV